MTINIYTDDVLWDEYAEGHHDATLEVEMDRLLASTLTWLTDLVGAQRVGAIFGREVEPATTLAPAPDERFINDILDDQFDKERFTDSATQAHTYSYLLKTFAFLGTVSRNEKQDLSALENLINWGDRVRAIPNAARIAPLFEVVSRAARSRYDLDTGQGTDMENFISLLAIARWPIGKSLNAEILDLPRKTVQNLVSSKTLKRDSSGNLSNQSAVAWIAEQFAYDYLFPSADVRLAQHIDTSRPAIEDPIFVPHIRCEQTMAIEPFLPDFRTPDGYEILNGAEHLKVQDYFEALKALAARPRARVLRATEAGQIAHGTCRGTFIVVERKKLLSLIGATGTKAASETQKEVSFPSSFGQAIASLPSISGFPKGHSKKLLRFASSIWGNLAVEPLKSSVNLYLLDTAENRKTFGSYVTSTTGPGPSGRNSNLNTIPAFKGHSLLVIRIIDVEAAEQLLKCLSGTSR